MIGMTNYITEAKWTDVFLVWYVLVDTGYQALEKCYGVWRRSGPEPVLHDSEVITIGLIIDTFFGGHEALGLAFLRQYHPELFPHLPVEGHFNERRTRLGPLIDQVRHWLTTTEGLLDSNDPVRLLDSAPMLHTGAGHDAGILTGAGISSAMLFVRNPTGISHSPAEFAERQDCHRGVEALVAVTRELAG